MNGSAAGTEFWSSAKTLQMLRETGCFDGDGGEDFSWPEDFKIFISQGVAIECITVASLFSD